MTNGLLDFDNKRNILQRRINNYCSKYFDRSFGLFPHALKVVDKLKNKEEWAKELDELIALRLNKVINEKDHIWFSKIVEEVVQVQIFFDSSKRDFVEIEKLGEDILKKQHEVWSFNWPEDALFNKWMKVFSQTNQLLPEEAKEEDDLNDLQIIDELEERKQEKSIEKIYIAMQTSDMAKEQPVVTMDMTVQFDDMEGEKHVAINFQISEPNTSCVNQMVPQLEEKQIQIDHSSNEASQQQQVTIEMVSPLEDQ